MPQWFIEVFCAKFKRHRPPEGWAARCGGSALLACCAGGSSPGLNAPASPPGAMPVASLRVWTHVYAYGPVMLFASGPQVCHNCGTTRTPLWRKEGGSHLCNAVSFVLLPKYKPCSETCHTRRITGCVVCAHCWLAITLKRACFFNAQPRLRTAVWDIPQGPWNASVSLLAARTNVAWHSRLPVASA